QIIKATKAMALTGYDILTDEKLRENIYEEFNNTVPKYSEEDLY
ncbi:MAG: amidohydrolase, partial [Tissierellia bacterium]|nr:amidohydrolase [Tissierellia bacterium]